MGPDCSPSPVPGDVLFCRNRALQGGASRSTFVGWLWSKSPIRPSGALLLIRRKASPSPHLSPKLRADLKGTFGDKVYLRVHALQQALHLGPSDSLEPLHPALCQDQPPEGPAELLLEGRTHGSEGGAGHGAAGSEGGGAEDSDSWVWGGEGLVIHSPRWSILSLWSPPPSQVPPNMTHVLQVGGHGDRVILKQVVRLREKTGSGLAENSEKQNCGDPEVAAEIQRERDKTKRGGAQKKPQNLALKKG